MYHTEDYRKYIELLEWKIRNVADLSESALPTQPQSKPDISTVVKLLQLTTLIYLERTATQLSGPSEKLTRLLDEAYATLRSIQTCQWPFPLLICACEARDDEERKVIADLVTQTESTAKVKNLRNLKSIIRFVWTQDDLAEGPGSYTDKITALISMSDSVPSFV